MKTKNMNNEIFKKFESRWESLGFDRLAQEEKETVALFWVEAEVMNGGLHQYFLNSSGDLYHFAIQGLKRLSALESLAALEEAAKKLGNTYPIDRDQRIDILEELGMDPDPFESETNVLQELPEPIFNMSLESLPKILVAEYA